MSDYEVVWSGTIQRQHGIDLLDGAGYRQKECPLTRAGLKQGELPSVASMKGKGNAQSWKESNRTAVVKREHPGGAGRGHTGVLFPGGYCPCGEPIGRAKWIKKYRRCDSCRAKRAAMEKPIPKCGCGHRLSPYELNRQYTACATCRRSYNESKWHGISRENAPASHW